MEYVIYHDWSGDNGKFLKYEIYISNDNGETYEKVHQGEWDKQMIGK